MTAPHFMLQGRTIQAYNPLHRHTYTFQSLAILERKKCNTFLSQEIVLVIGSTLKGRALDVLTTQFPPSKLITATILVNGNLILCVAQTKHQSSLFPFFSFHSVMGLSTNPVGQPSKYVNTSALFYCFFLLQLQLELLSSSPK